MLLAPVDFDMAFSKDEFALELDQFEEWMVLERNALLVALAGDQLLNSGARGFAEFQDKKWMNLKWGLRDTMVQAYVSGLNGKKDTCPVNVILEDCITLLIELALLVTSSKIA